MPGELHRVREEDSLPRDAIPAQLEHIRDVAAGSRTRCVRNLNGADPALDAARRAARQLLFGPVAQVPAGAGEPQRASLAAWSLAHGLATLLLSSNLPPELTRQPEDLARSVAAYLFGSPA